MDLTLILGPMKSGKSFDLISYFAPLRYTDISHVIYQSARHVRDGNIHSRTGAAIEAKVVSSLTDALDKEYQVVGVDELHMFLPADVEVIAKLLDRGVRVIGSGLDMDYRGEMFDVIKKLLELGPKDVKYKRAVCEKCRKPTAVYSQVFNQGEPLTGGMPPVIPEDGTFTYQAVCRNCFIKS